MTAITYPGSLPGPQSMTLQPAERRALAGIDGQAPASARAQQRDYGAAAQISFVFSPDQYAVWLIWWQMALGQGAAWFSAPQWPFPWGLGGVVRVAGVPRVGHAGRGVRSVQIDAEVRGASAAPQQTAHPTPVSLVDATDTEVEAYGPDMLQMVGLVVRRADGLWYRPGRNRATLQELGAATPLGALVNPLRGGTPCTAVQFRGTGDTSGSLGRLGIVVNGDNNTAAAARLSVGAADRRSLVTGSSTAGYAHLIPWDDTIELVHIAQLSMAGTYTVVDTGPCSAASAEFLRLTFDDADAIVALLVEEGPPTNFAGAAGTGSARLLRVRGVRASETA